MAEAAQVEEEVVEEITEEVTPTDKIEEKTEDINIDWRSDLPDDLKKTAERFTSKADAIRAIADLRKRESQVRVPGKNASEDEVAAYHKAIGIPENPEDYEFADLPEDQLTDDIKASRQVWGQRFKELGIPARAAKEMSKLINEDTEKMMALQIESDKAFAKSQEEALRSEWRGEDFDKNKTLANRAFSEIANRAGINLDDLTKIETKDGRFLMDRAEMVKVFAVIGREMSEGSLGPAMSESERDTTEDQIREVRKQISEAQSVGDSKLSNKLYQKEQDLIKKLSGSNAIVGSEGRAA